MTRKEEVDIAKKIERGREELLSMVLNCPIAVREIISLGDDLRAGDGFQAHERVHFGVLIRNLHGALGPPFFGHELARAQGPRRL